MLLSSIASTEAASRMHRVSKVHFIGAGGSGMSGIAEVLHNQGYEVSGSDLKATPLTQHLQALGIEMRIGHDAEYLGEVDVVVVSGAIPENNPELLVAKSRRIPVISRAEMLAELMRFKFGIAVAGAHGKTTVTSLLASILERAGKEPTFVVGGLLKSAGGHGRLGRGDYIVAEADESDASFLHLRPLIAVITNIDEEHMEAFVHSIEQIDAAFLSFLKNLPFYGLAVLCGDDAGVQRILSAVSRRTLTYGFGERNDFRAIGYKAESGGCRFKVQRPDTTEPLAVYLPLIGRHNVLNALAAISVATDEGVADEVLVEALADFSGIERRCEFHKNLNLAGHRFDLVDDYGHHPAELTAVLTALRDIYAQRRFVLIFQPHRYSRTRDHHQGFVEALEQADELLLMDVYAAGESPIPGADSLSLQTALCAREKLKPTLARDKSAALLWLREAVRTDDVVITQGAGDILELKQKLVEVCQ